jgi:hypothetical protein
MAVFFEESALTRLVGLVSDFNPDNRRATTTRLTHTGIRIEEVPTTEVGPGRRRTPAASRSICRVTFAWRAAQLCMKPFSSGVLMERSR